MSAGTKARGLVLPFFFDICLCYLHFGGQVHRHMPKYRNATKNAQNTMFTQESLRLLRLGVAQLREVAQSAPVTPAIRGQGC